jgi:alkaline phosphatase
MIGKNAVLVAAGLVCSCASVRAAPGRPGPGGPQNPGGIKNFIYIVPDGYGQHSQVMARDYAMLTANNATADNPGPISFELGADKHVIGTVRTWASDNLITDSAASGTAFACGYKSYNDAVGITPDLQPVGSILETAKLAGFKTGLVVTSTINHATPAVYAAHVANRDSYEAIAAQEIGYSHPLGSMVDILLGGGRCYFKPQSDETSCRSDDIDLFGFAEEKGFTVMQDRAGFDALEKGQNAELPYIGLFNDDQMMYEIDRSKEPESEPSLLEMVETALVSLDIATNPGKPGKPGKGPGKGPHGNNGKGYFIMIEASRIDHAGHANDAASHLHETLMYNDVIDFVTNWIDEHPDTMMMSAADHECGGLTTNGFDPLPLALAEHSFEYYQNLWEDNEGDAREFLTGTVLPGLGLTEVEDEDLEALLAAEEDDLWTMLTEMQAENAGVNWSTGGHTAGDINLHLYAAGEQRLREAKADMAGNRDNTELPRYIEKVLGLNMDETTRKLQEIDGGNWVPREDAAKLRKRAIKSRDGHAEGHSHSH